MSIKAEQIRSILASLSGLGIGLRPQRYDGDVADLLTGGRSHFAPALAITVYFDGPRSRFVDGVAGAWESFLQRAGSRLTWYADQDLGRWREVSARRLRRPAARLANPKPMPFYSWTAVSGATFEDASDSTFRAIVRDGAGGNLSFMRITFPVAGAASQDSLRDFIALARDWCEGLPLLHGYGGFTINASPQVPQLKSAMLLQIAERFHGFEIDACGGTVLVARDRIKGANWLTFLGPRFVELTGGLAVLRDRFSTRVELHPLRDGGVIVQAGPQPTYGDVDADDALATYKEVARTLRPICLDTHPDLGPSELGSFSREKTELWLRRLDS